MQAIRQNRAPRRINREWLSHLRTERGVPRNAPSSYLQNQQCSQSGRGFAKARKSHGRSRHEFSGLAWVTGSAGFLGHHLVRLAGVYGGAWQVRPISRSQLDLTDGAAVSQLFELERPALILHCAAMSRSPACEANPDLARRTNVDATAQLARLSAETALVFLSSDLVFDGSCGRYRETDQPRPLSVYGATKAEAENRVLENPRNLVIRTSLTAGDSPTGDRSFNEDLCAAWRSGRTVRLFTDEFRSPLPVEATARAVWELAMQGAAGIFHVAGADRLSRWEIGRIVASMHPELNPRLEAASIRDYVGAPRPADTSLDCAKVRDWLSFRLPGLREWGVAARRPAVP